jgi:hypothetical protein
VYPVCQVSSPLYRYGGQERHPHCSVPQVPELHFQSHGTGSKIKLDSWQLGAHATVASHRSQTGYSRLLDPSYCSRAQAMCFIQALTTIRPRREPSLETESTPFHRVSTGTHHGGYL